MPTPPNISLDPVTFPIHRNFWRIRYTSTFDATHHNNGDGSLIYPGVDGPLGSLRLAAMVDGIEDWNIFRRLGLTVNGSDGGPGSTAQPGRIWSRSADIITQLIENSSCYSVLPDPSLPKPWPSPGSHHDVGCGRVDDPRLLERLRREAAHRVIAKVPRGPLRCDPQATPVQLCQGGRPCPDCGQASCACE